MRHVRMLGLCLLAVFAVGAVAAGSASAKLPEFGKCLATESGSGGRYRDAACVEHAPRRHGEYSGGYEWKPIKREHLQPLELQGTMVFETASKARIECGSSFQFDEDRLTGPKEAITPLWAFEGCASEGHSCHSSVSIEEGEITNESAFLEEEGGGVKPGWMGSLGFVSRESGPTPVVGMQYTAKNQERLYPPVECASEVGTVWFGGYPYKHERGSSFISTLSPVNRMTSAFTETLSESAPGVAWPSKLLHHKPESLLALRNSEWEPMAIVGTFRAPVEEEYVEMEIKATA